VSRKRNSMTVWPVAMHSDVRDGRGIHEAMSEREMAIRKRFSDDMDPDYDDARYLISVIDTIRDALRRRQGA
jgi:hypothetical protein